jgi:hypothetical protein
MQPGTPDQESREDCATRRVLEPLATKWTSMVLQTHHARHGGVARTGVLQCTAVNLLVPRSSSRRAWPRDVDEAGDGLSFAQVAWGGGL